MTERITPAEARRRSLLVREEDINSADFMVLVAVQMERNQRAGQFLEVAYRDMIRERDTLAAKIADYKEKAQALTALVVAVDDLIADSIGICGLHHNGDLATWTSLTRGGAFEWWLGALDDARDLLPKKEG
jgi:hypothetical protein